MEIIGPKWRAFAGQMNHIYYSFGCISASIISYYFRSWSSFTYVVIILHVPLLFFWFFVPESPRWLFMKKRGSEGAIAVKKLIGSPAKEIKMEFYKALEEKTETEVVESIASMGSICSVKTDVIPKAPNENSVRDMMRFPTIRKATIVIFFAFFVIAMVYMGISYNAAELPGSIWLNNAINGILDAVAQLLGNQYSENGLPVAYGHFITTSVTRECHQHR